MMSAQLCHTMPSLFSHQIRIKPENIGKRESAIIGVVIYSSKIKPLITIVKIIEIHSSGAIAEASEHLCAYVKNI